MSPAHEGLTSSLELFAGSSTAIVVLAGHHPSTRQRWLPVLDRAERIGFSGVLATDLPAPDTLDGLGISLVCLVAAGKQCEAALRHSAAGRCNALVLISPALDLANLASIVRPLRLPRLVMASSEGADAANARALDAASAGPVALRFFPSRATGEELLDGSTGALVGESVWLFAARTLGTPQGLPSLPSDPGFKETTS